MSEALLTVSGLRVDAPALDVNIVAEVSFSLDRGRTLALVGESASGKSTVAMALLGHAQPGLRISGSVVLGGEDLVALDQPALRRIRGRRISFVAQDPSTSLNPTMRVGAQVAAIVRAHRGSAHVREAVCTAFERAQLSSADAMLRRFPHELSGGQQQRVAIAAALACEPDVVVMDEPTTSLDVTTQARLLDVIERICSDDGRSVVYVSHDLAVVRNLAEDILVMYGGRVVEDGSVERIFRAPAHPYTRRLLEAVPPGGDLPWRPVGIPGTAAQPGMRPRGCAFAPRCRHRTDACGSLPALEPLGAGGHVRCVRHHEMTEIEPAPVVADAVARVGEAGGPVLQVRGLQAAYGRRELVLDLPELEVASGSCVAVVGESGSGKSTLLRCLVGLHEPLAGELRLAGNPVPWRPRRRSAAQRRGLQIVPQNPYSSLNPRHEVALIISRPLRFFGGLRGPAATERVHELLDAVGLPKPVARRRPAELSGGERQRVAIARALAADPEVLLCDEITSALDVAVQAGVLNLLGRLAAERRLGIVFVSHDLATVRGISDRVAVLERGRICEDRPAGEIFRQPDAAYTRELLAAVPALMEGDWPVRSRGVLAVKRADVLRDDASVGSGWANGSR